jgi:hypothetical protein
MSAFLLKETATGKNRSAFSVVKHDATANERLDYQ